MDQGRHATDHREYEDLLAAAALGVLTESEHAELRAHLAQCDSCRQSYGALIAAVDALPLSVEEREPSAQLRDRLRTQIEQTPQIQPAHRASTASDRPTPLPVHEPAASERRGRKSHLTRISAGWLAAAVMTLVVGLIGGILADRLLFDDADEPRERTIALEYPSDMQSDAASLTYLPDVDILRFAADDLPDLPAGDVYQAWLIAGADHPPTPVGIIDPETGLFATTFEPGSYATFAVTVESGPLGSEQPTSDPVIVASLPGQSET